MSVEIQQLIIQTRIIPAEPDTANHSSSLSTPIMKYREQSILIKEIKNELKIWIRDEFRRR